MRINSPQNATTVGWRNITGLDDALRSAVAAGFTASKTAELLSKTFRPITFTRNMCIGRCKRLGLRFGGGKSVQPKKVTL